MHAKEEIILGRDLSLALPLEFGSFSRRVA